MSFFRDLRVLTNASGDEYAGSSFQFQALNILSDHMFWGNLSYILYSRVFCSYFFRLVPSRFTHNKNVTATRSMPAFFCFWKIKTHPGRASIYSAYQSFRWKPQDLLHIYMIIPSALDTQRPYQPKNNPQKHQKANRCQDQRKSPPLFKGISKPPQEKCN